MKIQAIKKYQKNLRRQRGEMPIGPILIIALIVLPLVIALIIYGGQIAQSFQTATAAVGTANGTAAGIHAAPPTAPGG